MEQKLKSLHEKAKALPTLPGVYLMHDKSGKIIYIGKAKALKNRVSQYFTNVQKHIEKVKQMVLRVNDFDYIICDSEFEALILEASLIKEYTPKYNILLKDDKGYSYIHISNEDWPRMTVEKRLKGDGENIGPYNSGFIVKQAVENAKRIYKLPQCSRTFSDNMKRVRPCLDYYIGLCSAPCAGKIKKYAYIESVKSAVSFIKKGSADAVKQLTEQMQAAAENLEFEKAATLRDKIDAINKIGEKQKVIISSSPQQDVIAYVQGQKFGCFEVFKFRSSKLIDQEHFFVDTIDEEPDARAQFIMQYYSIRDDIPLRILVDSSAESVESIERWLTEKKGRKVSILNPKKGESKKIVELCRTNAAERIAQKEGMSVHQTAVLDELRRLLGLNKTPDYIEAYDISHTSGQDNVAGMVVFENGKPNKKAYRKFAIKGFSGQDDYRSMEEVIQRRLNEYQQNKQKAEGFGKLPDLILLDGGKGQLNSVLPIVKSFAPEIAVYGMVKDSHHRTRALVGENGEVEIKPTRNVFNFISEIQNEVHRFAISYHRQKKSSRSLALQLTQIQGIGDKRAQLLLKHFKSIKNIANATVEQISEIKGIDKKTAQNISDFYNKS